MIALDLDNTIVCYDGAFRAAAEACDCLPASGTPIDKASVKAAAFARGGNELWTRLQGIAYGEGISQAELFPGCREFLELAMRKGEELVVLSHKTEFPVIGLKVNLRLAAMNWIESKGLGLGDRLPVIFCDSRQEKVNRLGTLACRALLDDLPEVFHTPGFPRQTSFILFDPSESHPEWSDSLKITSWKAATDLLLCHEPGI